MNGEEVEESKLKIIPAAQIEASETRHGKSEAEEDPNHKLKKQIINNNNNNTSPSSTTTTTTKNNSNTSSAASEEGGKAKSCKGCLYYSSVFKSQSRNPMCVGLTRSLPNVPQYVVGQSELEASKEGRSLTDFRYGCIGYSLYLDHPKQQQQQQHQSSNADQQQQHTQTELPVCVGLEVLVDRRVNNNNNTSAVDSASAPITHAHNNNNNNKQDTNGLPQRRSPKPTNPTGDEFFTRFTRNATLVANGVAKNVRRVGNQIKQGLDDILYRRPK